MWFGAEARRGGNGKGKSCGEEVRLEVRVLRTCHLPRTRHHPGARAGEWRRAHTRGLPCTLRCL